jgi:Transposase DDE domain
MCASCELRPDCTTSEPGRQILGHFQEEYVDRVKSCRGTFPFEKALRKRRVWVEPLFAEAKDWHGLRRFRLRRLEKVNIEALLTAAGQNIKRLVVARDRGLRKLAQVAALRLPDRVSRCRPHLTGGFSYFLWDKGVFQQPGKLRASVNRDGRRMKNGHEMFHHAGSPLSFPTKECSRARPRTLPHRAHLATV